MLKKWILLAIALVLCLFAGVGLYGLVFAAAALFVSFPRFMPCRWYEVIMGALASSIAVLVAGDSSLLFWGLLAVAAVSLSITSLWKTILLGIAAFFLLRFEAEAVIYVTLFIGIIWNAILVFTYERFYGTIKL